MSEELASFLKDRILGFDRKPASQFLFNPSNWRKHPQPQRDAVRASLGELGWIDVVIENRQTGHLLDGHERIWNALQIDEDEPVPYIQVDLTPEEEKLALWVIDGTAAMAETDKEALDVLLRDINTGEEALQAALAEAAIDAGVMPPDFSPVFMENIPRLDQRNPVYCPHCGMNIHNEQS